MDKHFLQYYQDITNWYKSEWQKQVNRVRENSESGGRLNICWNVKSDLVTESHVANEQSVGVRKVLAGLQVGSLLLGMETGHWDTILPTDMSLARLWGSGGPTPFSNCLPTFKDLRLELFNYCYFLSRTPLIIYIIISHNAVL